MTADEMISKAEQIVNKFIDKILDKSEKPERKQVFFLENQDELRKCMDALKKSIDILKKDDGEENEEERNLLIKKAENIILSFEDAIKEFQKELMIKNDVQEEDTTATLTQTTIEKAMKTDKTTQEISQKMSVIAGQHGNTEKPLFNYALLCDNNISLIAAQNKEELNLKINEIANQGSYKSISLYEMTFNPVPLKKKTVLSV